MGKVHGSHDSLAATAEDLASRAKAQSTLSGDLSPGAVPGQTEVTGILSHPLPALTAGYLSYTGSAWAFVGGGAGSPNAIEYFDPTGGVTVSDPNLTAALPDAYSRPQIHDKRVNPTTGRGSVYRLGAWSTDGDPTDATSEGYVTYGPNALGNGPNQTDGGMGFYEPNGFGVLDVISGHAGGNTFYLCGFEDGGPAAPFGLDGFIVNDNDGNAIFWVKRTDKSTAVRSLRVGFAPAASSQWTTGAGSPNGVVVGSPGDLYTNTSGGEGTTLWVKQNGVGTNTGWAGK